MDDFRYYKRILRYDEIEYLADKTRKINYPISTSEKKSYFQDHPVSDYKYCLFDQTTNSLNGKIYGNVEIYTYNPLTLKFPGSSNTYF